MRVVVLTGAGPKAFVAGADIGEMSGLTPARGRDFSLRGSRMMRGIEKMPKPVIAMINGFALAGGLELAMSCHLRIAADTAGRPARDQPRADPGCGGTQRLIRPPGARPLGCADRRAHRRRACAQLGIVNRVVPAAELVAETIKLATQLANAAPLALRGILDCIDTGGEVGIGEGLEYESAQFGLVFSTDDMREGTGAFLEKRKPAFKGR